MLFAIIVMLLLGLVAGAVARAVVPGDDGMGIGGTILLGVAGSLVGGFLGNALQPGDQDGIDPAGLLGSIVGAIVVLLVYRAVSNRSRGSRIV